MGTAGYVMSSPDVLEFGLINFEYDMSDACLGEVIAGEGDISDFVDDRVGESVGNCLWKIGIIVTTDLVGVPDSCCPWIQCYIISLIAPSVL